MPSEAEESKPYLETETYELKIASDYSGLSFSEVIKLDCITYKILVRDGFIEMMKETEEGREYLENCWLLTQTEPDKDELRKRFK